MIDNKEVRTFYNNFKDKLIQDFLQPNLRIENAIKRTLRKVPLDSKNILDLGFGLGWSSYEFARHIPKATVKAYDISEELTKTAKDIFQLPNLEYSALDLTYDFPKGSFDAIILLDVFEHIPLQSRDQFFLNVKNALSEKGKVIFTCPTIYHQNFLKENKPEGLQPIDEDIDLKVIEEFAIKTNTTISHFEYFDVWNNRDYLLCVIERPFLYLTKPISKTIKEQKLLNFYDKYTLLKKAKTVSIKHPVLISKQKLYYIFNKIFNS